jgi:riboflavin biosynthesis pyrimidine reductase
LTSSAIGRLWDRARVLPQWQDRRVQSLYPTTPSALSHDDLVEIYSYPHERRWVRANFVTTLDGAAQGSDSKSGTLSSAADRALFALLRSLCDVVLVGANTTRVEGYQPIRPSEIDAVTRSRLGLAPVPTLAVVTRSLDLDTSLLEGGEAPTIVVTTEDSAAARADRLPGGVPVIAAGQASVDFAAALDQLGARGLQRVLCEGGPSLMRDLVATGRLDELCLTIRPLVVAGDRFRIARGEAVIPDARLALRTLLESDGDLFARYVRG